MTFERPDEATTPDETPDRPVSPVEPEPAPSGETPARSDATAEPADAETDPAGAATDPTGAATDPAPRAAEPAHPEPHPDDVVFASGISRSFGDRLVVRDMTLSVRRGTILGVIGPSGSGKTTTIRMITGALRPTSGEIRVLGERPTGFRRSTRERIGYMPQLFTLYPDLSARENVDFVASLFGLLWPRRRRRTKEVLKLLDLWDSRNRRASNMSGGMQRRLELACALVHDPALLILDEPTAGIDPLLRVKVWEELHRLRDLGRTILVTTQYVSEAEECDQVALIAGGRLVAYAPPDELRRQAVGGQAIEIETAELFDGATIESVPGVLEVEQVGPHSLRVRVEDAAAGLPAVVDAITAAGGDVSSAQEQRLTFDEIFAELVERAGNGDVDGEGVDQESAA